MITALVLLFAGLLVMRPKIQAPMVRMHPGGAPPMIPFLFITIACGAISGFHGLVSSGTTSKQEQILPEGLTIRRGPAGVDESELLVAGEVDALFHAAEPKAFREGNPIIGRLFPDYRRTERAYFAETGIFPIMHVVVIRRELVERYPWLANNLRAAFEQARDCAAPRLMDNAFCTTSLAWEASYAEEERKLLGDAFRYGVQDSRGTLEAFCRYGFDQGFTSRLLTAEELFVESTLTGAKV